ncbi:GNAT family N-acetyltransferase (plasmid) [Deinococcus radiomollis]|uniref:GNAT family N-acetyltransferase n=1 Tax=Deinococcus radiomollis TaxID=468916 RepID=UPI0038918159
MTNDAMRLQREQRWEHLLQDPSQITYVLTKDHTVMGLVNAGPMRIGHQVEAEHHTRYDAEIMAFYLLKSLHGHGAGKALFRRAVNELKARGFRSMALWVLKGNPTCAFYQHMGGTQDGSKCVTIPEGELQELRFGWRDLQALNY